MCRVSFVCVLLLLLLGINRCAIADMKLKLNDIHPKTPLGILLQKRYSCRSFKDLPLKLDALSLILWSTYGEKYDARTGASKTIPSAGARYPLRLYVVVGQEGVDTLGAGVYEYLVEEHSLQLVAAGDRRKQLARACLSQDFVQEAPVSIVIAARFQQTTARYGKRGENYVYMEAGHASQNTYLAVTSAGLCTVEVGAFLDEEVQHVLGINKEVIPLLVMPIGYGG